MACQQRVTFHTASVDGDAEVQVRKYPAKADLIYPQPTSPFKSVDQQIENQFLPLLDESDKSVGDRYMPRDCYNLDIL